MIYNFYIRDVLECIINQVGSVISNFRYKGYYYDSAIYKENEVILDFEIEMGNEYTITKKDKKNIKRRTYAIVYYDDIYASKI